VTKEDYRRERETVRLVMGRLVKAIEVLTALTQRQHGFAIAAEATLGAVLSSSVCFHAMLSLIGNKPLTADEFANLARAHWLELEQQGIIAGVRAEHYAQTAVAKVASGAGAPS
jgi:hypothetical protein